MDEANLKGAYLQGADLRAANLKRAELQDIRNWREIKNIEYANIYGVTNSPEGFIEWAKEHGAVEVENYDEWQTLINEQTKR